MEKNSLLYFAKLTSSKGHDHPREENLAFSQRIKIFTCSQKLPGSFIQNYVFCEFRL